MVTRKKKYYAQCMVCGHIYQTEKLNIEIMYIDHQCPKCGAVRGLNVGSDILDKFLYYDVIKDERYYT